MFNFFKKQKKAEPAAGSQPAAALNDIEIYVMPEKFRRAFKGSSATKKVGIFIIAGGSAIIILIGAVLIWYIKNSGSFTAVDNSGQSAAQQSAPDDNTAANDNINTADNNQTEPVDLEEKNCGTGYILAGSEETDEALSCFGERVGNGCQPASAMINAADFGLIKFSVLGLRQDKCLVGVDYGSADEITNEDFKIYANTSVQCLYSLTDLAAMHYEAGHLASYLYAQSGVSNETNNSCSGTAIDRRAEELARASKAAADITLTFMPGVDSDEDGLTDIEEAVFSTDVNNSDTDGDTYQDGAETINLYNPAGAGTLAGSGLVLEYVNSVYGYSLFYPSSFRLEDKFNGESVFFFSGVDGSIQVLAQDNPDQKDVISWYADLVGSAAEEITAEKITTKKGIAYIYSPDGLTAYLSAAGSSRIFVITYSPEESGAIQFKTTLEMMINSFILK